MNPYWSKRLEGVEPYVPGEQPREGQFIKLNTNENPYPPSPGALRAIADAASDALRLYPKPECDELRQTIADYYGLSAESVFVGNGSDEVLAMAFLAFFSPEDRIAFPAISYSFYPVYADLFQIPYEAVPLREDFTLDIDVFRGDYRGIVFANPNAPTGIELPRPQVEQILCDHPDIPVIVDEAYVDFGAESAAALIERYPNLLVIQTFSKSRSLAGLRVGFALGQPHLIQAINTVKNSFNSYTLDLLAQAGATAAMEDRDYFEQTCRKIIATREWSTAELEKLGFTVLPSKTNFLFASHPDKDAAELFAALRERHILVRYFQKPIIDRFLRITVGTDEEMEKLIQALKEILETS